MRFVADESCDFNIVRALREAGHDVLSVHEEHQGATDQTVARLAVESKRVLITEDKDFGQLLWAAPESAGVILVRFPSDARASIVASVLAAVAKNGSAIAGAFVVVEPGRLRISPRIR